MPFTIDGKEFEEDINLTQEHFYEKLMSGAEVFTSQPTIGIIAKKWDEILKTHERYHSYTYEQWLIRKLSDSNDDGG